MPPQPIATDWLASDASTKLMVEQMQRLVDNAFVDPNIRQMAVDVVRYQTPRDYTAAALRLRQYCADHIRFLRDPDGRELSYTPQLMLRTIKDYEVANVDCDDAAVFAASLGRSIGLRARFVLLGFLKPTNPLAHVYTELAGPGKDAKWIEMDVTRSQREIPFSMIARRVIVPAKLPVRAPLLSRALFSGYAR